MQKGSPAPVVTSVNEEKGDRQKYASDSEIHSDLEESAPIAIPWSYKWIALLCVVAFPVGQTWTGSALGPLKNTLRIELGITNTQFGVISSADAIINSIWPIIGGMLLDWYGPDIIAPICTIVIFVGSIISACGININAWRMLTGGNILMGFGIAVLDSATQKFFYHWFGSSGLALAFGLESAVSKTVGLVSQLTAIPIKNGTGWYGWVFWISVVFCGFSVLVTFTYLLFVRYFVPKSMHLTSLRSQALLESKSMGKFRFRLSSLTDLPWAFWMLPMTQLLQSGAAGGFDTSSSDLIRMKGYSEEVSAYLSSADYVLPIVLSPVVGLLIDRYGHRFHYVALAPIFWIICCSLLGFTDLHPLVALVFSSLAGTINSMPLQICIPLLLGGDQGKIGTAFGVWRAFNNSGSTIMDIVFGVLQDGTEDMGYDRVLKMAIGLKAWAFFLGLFYIFIDYTKLGKGMTMTLKQREARESQIVDRKNDPLTSRAVKPWITYTALAELISIIIVAWVVFIKYLM
ncbi:major facilitator superfamily transporter [Phlyctema vagabunda]|uniref:Lysosomal dipeptide transporter MFSD1 n=1 Tax=Phlyctema vagabunda TaxID=108571 RepID=A0ABR4PH50_9HELO